jgi:hypothetical protein
MLFSNPFIDIDRDIPESYSEMLARYPEDEKGVFVNISELNPDLISGVITICLLRNIRFRIVLHTLSRHGLSHLHCN